MFPWIEWPLWNDWTLYRVPITWSSSHQDWRLEIPKLPAAAKTNTELSLWPFSKESSPPLGKKLNTLNTYDSKKRGCSYFSYTNWHLLWLWYIYIIFFYARSTGTRTNFRGLTEFWSICVVLYVNCLRGIDPFCNKGSVTEDMYQRIQWPCRVDPTPP